MPPHSVRCWRRENRPQAGLTSEAGGRRTMQALAGIPSYSLCYRASEESAMNRMRFLAGVCFAALLAAVPAFAQTDANKPKEPQKPALTGSAAILEQWNDVGRKLIAIAEDLPEAKYDYKPNPESRPLRARVMPNDLLAN